MNRYRHLLAKRDFALLWGGATVSALGDGMSFVALVWLIIERGGTPAEVGWLAAVYTAPVVVGGIAAGVILDRFDRRRVIAADNVIRGIAIASVPVAAALGVLTTAHLFVVAAIYGLLFMTSIAGIPSLIPALVDESDLTTANAMESISYGIAGLVGPALAGVVIAVLGAPSCSRSTRRRTRSSSRACWRCVAAAVGRRGARAPDGDGATVQRRRSARGSGRQSGSSSGPRRSWRRPVMYMCLNISGGISLVVIPVYALDVLGGGPATYGLLLSALTAGELIGLLVIGAVQWPWALGRSIAVGALLSGLILSLLLLRPQLPVILLVLAASGSPRRRVAA
jgi:predicted MFS family arabinose efflux permease